MNLKIYYPLPKFPPISLSGTQCRLNCQHCNREYLRGMAPATTPDALVALCHRLKKQGAHGVLLSGGSDRGGGILNLPAMLDALHRIKAETGLILNIHPGLVDEATARALAPQHDGVDFASLEIPSDATIRDVFGLDASREGYLATYRRLRNAGVNVVPHVAVYDGTEDRLLAGLESEPPEVIVVIVFSPTRDTPMAASPPPTPKMVGDVISRIGARFPAAEIALGCMRPRDRALRDALELAALEAGVLRMELPSRKTQAIAQSRGYTLHRLDACCALPAELEASVQ
jgi:hypothetical protein